MSQTGLNPKLQAHVYFSQNKSHQLEILGSSLVGGLVGWLVCLSLLDTHTVIIVGYKKLPPFHIIFAAKCIKLDSIYP